MKSGHIDNEGNIYMGPCLKEFRETFLKVTQFKMALELGVSQKEISFWENNIKPMPRFYVKKLIEVYGKKSVKVVKEYQSLEIGYLAAIN